MKFCKGILCAAFAAAALTSSMTALAADTASFWLNPMFVEGREVYSWGPDGQSKAYLSYKGTIYVQLRTVAEWMGKEVAWDGDALTISLSGSVPPVYHEQKGQDNLAAMSDEELAQWFSQKVAVTAQPDITVLLDGAAQNLKDASGNPVCPITYQGTNYLPLRAVAEISGMEIKYQSANEGSEAVFLKSQRSDSEMTAYHTYLETLPQQQVIAGLKYTDLRSIEDCKKQLQTCKAAMEALKNTPKPEGGLLDSYYENMLPLAEKALDACYAAEQKLDDGLSLDDAITLLHTSTTEQSCVMEVCTAPFQFVNTMRMVVAEQFGSL